MHNVRDLKPGDVIYGTDAVTRVVHGAPIASKTTAETTGGTYIFPTDRQVPGSEYR